MNKEKSSYADYTHIKEIISSGELTSSMIINVLQLPLNDMPKEERSASDVVNFFTLELNTILLEDHTQLCIKKLSIFEKDMVGRYANDYLIKYGLSGGFHIQVIKDIENIREAIVYQKRIAEEKFLCKHIDTIVKNKDIILMDSTLKSLNEQYRDALSIEKKWFLWTQAKKIIRLLPSDQKNIRNNKFDSKNIIPLTPQP